MANHMPDHGKHVAIVGSRQRTDRETVDRLVAALPPGTVVVSGRIFRPDLEAFVAPSRKDGTEDAIRRARKKGIPITLPLQAPPS